MEQGREPGGRGRRRSPRRAQDGGLNTDYRLATRHRSNLPYMDPWIVPLLLEYKESVIKTDGQLGQVIKFLSESKVHQDAQQDSETVLHIGDGLHYIEVVTVGKATEVLKQSGYSEIIGQFISLEYYRVNFKRTAEMEDCRFYLTLERLQVIRMKRMENSLQNCNQEQSVLQKIKELWQKGFAMQLWFNSEKESQSVSQVLNDVNQDQLNTLKQNARDCLNLLGPSKLLDSEQLAVYPDTKWQLERKRDKGHQDVFTVPAKYLVISPENEAALSRSYTSDIPQAVAKGDENVQEDDRSTISFFSAGSSSLNESLDNPWDAVPGIILSSSSDASGTSPSLPQMQQMLSASPAEEANSESCTGTSRFLEPCDNMPHCSSEQAAPPFPPLFRIQNSEFLSGMTNQNSDLITSARSDQASELTDSIPCGQPLNKSDHHESNSSFELVSANRKGRSSHVHGAKRMTSGRTYFETEKNVSAKRKQGPNEEEPFETSTPTCSSNLDIVGHCSTETVTKSSDPNKKHVNQYRPLKFVSIPKKRRAEGIQHQESNTSAHCSCTERHLEKRREQEPVGIVTTKSKQVGVQQKKNAKDDRFQSVSNPPTPDLRAQLESVKISRALLGWARWIFENAEKQ